MRNIIILTPEQSGYWEDPVVESALAKIDNAIRDRVFYIVPGYDYHDNLIPKIEEEIGPYGWRIEKEWKGSQEDGYQIWNIIPNRERRI